jgi:Zn-dependent M28 family amino/carboxypeptidase
MRAHPIRSRPLELLFAGRLALAFLILLSLSCSSSPAGRWWSDVLWLAADEREGRETGSEGYLSAARYVARRFERAGARPAGPDGYFQQVRFVTRRIQEGECLLALVRDGRADSLTLGEDASFSTSFDAPESLEADAVFVGYGIKVPEYGYDDLEGLDLQGKIAVFLKGGPASLPVTVRAHAQYVGERWKHLRAAGAIGFAQIFDPEAMSVPWERGKLFRFERSFTFADTSLDEQRGRKFGIQVNPASAERFFEGSGRGFQEILAIARRGDPLPRFALAKRIRARVRLDRGEAASPNVIGIIEGSDPVLKHESVVLSAHLDHLGVGVPINGDSIYNGAMDNASGVATLIEIARSLRVAGHRPLRSIVLLALTGEEKGLLGSRAFAVDPTGAAGRIVANVNLDMFMPIVPFHSVIAHGVDESTLGERLRALAESSGVRVQPDPRPEQTIFIRSDQYNFVRAGVPALFITFGETGDSTLDRRFETWFHDRYHAPSDDVRQPVEVDAAVAFNRLLERFIREVADAPERPRWKAESYFRRFARDSAAVAPPGAPGGAGGARIR